MKSLVSILQSAHQSSRYPSAAAADAIDMSSQQKQFCKKANLPLFSSRAGVKQTKFNKSEIKFEAKTLKVEQQANTHRVQPADSKQDPRAKEASGQPSTSMQMDETLVQVIKALETKA